MNLFDSDFTTFINGIGDSDSYTTANLQLITIPSFWKYLSPIINAMIKAL